MTRRPAFTPDEIVAGINRALQERELDVIPALVTYLAGQDPDRAAEVVDTLCHAVNLRSTR